MEETAEQMLNVQAPSVQTGFYDMTGQGGMPGQATELPSAVENRNLEPDPEITAPTPDITPTREAQPEAETEDVDLQPLQLDAADENPPTSDAVDVPVPENS